ncbi:MAG: hypothetical protein EI684_06710 [Candidatus Viridilinea halotolerans]|uniref:AMP-activated protein kinase glycogen-binding domain-containing protein n=1 Tax=Candidatus Viridilinea halotolerans TaxID=2491704 RepID=A0A426U3Y3_9CHLR|nr:MAG: hypothetical protein EI684_06710 [Candidatus Viridilinea halotolerans]
MIIQQFTGDGQVLATFRLSTSIWADSIFLVGDFNEWNTRATPMSRGEQYWEATLILKPGGTYYYAYLVDGTDWCSEHTRAFRTIGGATQPITFIPIEILQARRKSDANEMVSP